MQIHELNERKVRQQNRAKAGIASQLIKKANANSQAKLTQQAQQAAPTSTPAVSSTNVVSGGPTPAEQEKLNARIAAATAAQPTAQSTPAQPTRPQNTPANPNVKSGGSKEAQAFRAQQAAQQPAQQPAQQATEPTWRDNIKGWGKAVKNAAVDSTRGKWDPAYAYSDPGRPAAAQPATPAPDMSAELAKLGITDRQVAGIGKILQQANNLNTRLTRTGDPAVDKFLQAMGYNVR
jgi:hypothetical protein